jgi:alanyl-tRNA synthetase
MDSSQVRKVFLDFFRSKEHRIVASAPMVIKNDPTLMFTNAGMNQFKDIFLGNAPAKYPRVANTQKCLRVSGKHNDLEEVGHDTYHHTMFEMLGNWSFGNYFKKEAIAWALELLTGVYKIPKENLYVTVFGGDKADGLAEDHEALRFWREIIPEERILFGPRKDNFWEMGDTGPCGPCSEIHIDIRDDAEKKAMPGKDLINKGHQHVLEIWNLVFIEFNRQSDGKLSPLPQKHVDTGMGFERLCMVLQGKKSNYDTDIFQPIISELSRLSSRPYGDNPESDVALRVVADHLRAVTFAIADGQLPSNTGAGYVIRRILRRAVRYGYTFLGLRDPFINELVPVLVSRMGDFFPEIRSQQQLVMKVIAEEEQAFLKTLSQGIRRFEQYTRENQDKKIIEGKFAFELFDTYGFPVDLTQLMAQESGWKVDMAGFNEGLEAQKNRSRQAAQVDTKDWVMVNPGNEETVFVGYESLEAEVEVIKYRRVRAKNEEYFEIVLNRTPFYAESGGQVGDKGYLLSGEERIVIDNTYKEHELIIHRSAGIFTSFNKPVKAVVDGLKRKATANNHSATHLMHAALRKVLGKHVEQKGSLVDETHLRFDFSHFSKMTPDEIRQVERLVNERIRENIILDEKRHVPFEQAKSLGAMALFGEKYGDFVRVITFGKDFSVELCGGTHVPATGQIGLFKITSESAIAAGIRRIEAVTAESAEEYIYSKEQLIEEISDALKNAKDVVKAVRNLAEENKILRKKIGDLSKYQVEGLKPDLIQKAEEIRGVRFITARLDIDAKTAKDLAFAIKNEIGNLFLLIATEDSSKVNLTLLIGDPLIKERGYNAGQMIRELAKEINGSGGGQPSFASAGGTYPDGVERAFSKAREILEQA